MKPDIALVAGEKCSGCSLCSVICSKQAIHMQEDSEGFLAPVIDRHRCINCGICYEKCPFNRIINNDNYLSPKIWACWHTDVDVVKLSSSGGAFTALAESIIDNGGAVYGACLNSDLEVIHLRVDSKNQLDHLRGSKYIQSHMENVYQNIRIDIKNGKDIMFSGTPCQVAGVSRFFGEIPNNLYTCELICHGVNSSSVFRAYMAYLQEKFEEPVMSVDFRFKETGLWNEPFIKIIFKNKVRCIPWSKDPFLLGFLKNYFLRRSCYNCYYAKVPRVADITIGDFWCWEKKNRPICFNQKGTSLVMVNNDKGNRLFAAARAKLESAPAEFSKAVLYNRNILKHTDYPKDYFNRKIIFDLIHKNELKILFEIILKRKSNIAEKINYYINNPDKLYFKVINSFKTLCLSVFNKCNL